MLARIFFLILIIFLAVNFCFVKAESMSSTNYKIQADSINVGGVRQTSSNYSSEDTIGETGTGNSSAANYLIKAGYQAMSAGSFLSISAPSNVDMGTIAGTGDTGLTGSSATWTIITDNSAGYKLEWQASSISMVSGSYTIGPYTPAIADTPENWLVGASDSEWGGRLSASSTDTSGEWGSLDEITSGAKWLNIASGSSRQIVSRVNANTPAGSIEKVFFRVEVGVNKTQAIGEYHTGITITATVL